MEIISIYLLIGLIFLALSIMAPKNVENNNIPFLIIFIWPIIVFLIIYLSIDRYKKNHN